MNPKDNLNSNIHHALPSITICQAAFTGHKNYIYSTNSHPDFSGLFVIKWINPHGECFAWRLPRWQLQSVPEMSLWFSKVSCVSFSSLQENTHKNSLLQCIIHAWFGCCNNFCFQHVTTQGLKFVTECADVLRLCF